MRRWPDVVTRHGPAGRLGGVKMAGRLLGSRGAPPGRAVRFPSFGCTFLSAGAGRYRDAAHDVALGPGALVTVFPGHPHWYGAVGQGGWDEAFVVFDGPVFELARQAGVLDVARPVRHLEPVDHWLRRLDRFRTRPVPRTSTGRDAEACELLALLNDVADGSPTPDGSLEERGWFERSCELLEADLERRLTADEVASAVGMPYETWRRRFAERAGRPPGAHRLRHRLDAAAAMARETSLSTREIAAALGFSDERHLVRHFRSAFGTTPRRYRDERR